LTRNSSASDIDVSPSAKAAAILRIGISSIMFGITSPLILMPLSEDDLTYISPTSSFDLSFWFLISINPPIDIRTSINPHLVGFKPTFLITIFDSLAIKPATIKNAADEKSPTTSYDFVAIKLEGVYDILFPA
jgi:hypothetical protein